MTVSSEVSRGEKEGAGWEDGVYSNENSNNDEDGGVCENEATPAAAMECSMSSGGMERAEFLLSS